MSFSCLGCPNRRIGCHSECETYLEEKAKLEANNERIREHHKREAMFMSRQYAKNIDRKIKEKK